MIADWRIATAEQVARATYTGAQTGDIFSTSSSDRSSGGEKPFCALAILC
jgi:hypothetical protein